MFNFALLCLASTIFCPSLERVNEKSSTSEQIVTVAADCQPHGKKRPHQAFPLAAPNVSELRLYSPAPPDSQSLTVLIIESESAFVESG
jgi:hypothetical protein